MNDSRGNFLELCIVSGAASTASISPSSAAATSHSINQQTGTMLEQLDVSSGLGGKSRPKSIHRRRLLVGEDHRGPRGARGHIALAGELTMARVFVSGSSTGLGLLTGKELLASGHDVVFHARNAARAEDLRREAPQATAIVVGDIGTIGGALDIADQVNAHGAMDAVIHNAGVGYGGALKRTAGGHPDILAVNVLAPYILTAVLSRPKRLVYLSSGMHRTEPHLDDILWQTRR